MFSNSKNNLCGTNNNAYFTSPTLSLREYNVSIQLVVLWFLCLEYFLTVPIKNLSLNYHNGNDEWNVSLESSNELLTSVSNAMAVAHYPSGSPPEGVLPWQGPFGNVGSTWGSHSDQGSTTDIWRSQLHKPSAMFASTTSPAPDASSDPLRNTIWSPMKPHRDILGELRPGSRVISIQSRFSIKNKNKNPI